MVYSNDFLREDYKKYLKIRMTKVICRLFGGDAFILTCNLTSIFGKLVIIKENSVCPK